MNKFLNAVCAIASIGSLAYVLISRKNTKNTIEKIVGDVESGISAPDISKEVVEAAVEKAAEKIAKEEAEKTREKIHDQVDKHLDALKEEKIKEISEEYAKKAVDGIDIDTIREKVESKASKMVVNKMLSKIDSYSSSIVNKIYSGSSWS